MTECDWQVAIAFLWGFFLWFTIDAVNHKYRFTDKLSKWLDNWVEKHKRGEL